MIFQTYNSAYELDDDRPRIRRLSGRSEPTPRQGTDGEWREYVELSDIVVGAPVLIGWRVVDANGLAVLQSTITSAVQAVREEAVSERDDAGAAGASGPFP